MFLKSCSYFRKGLLTAAVVASLGGFGIAQAADVGTATGALPKAPPPLVPATPVKPAALPAMPATPATVPATVPAKPMTMPSAVSPAQTTPKAAPVASATAAGVDGNPDGSCPASSPIKGSKSKIYHVPEGRNYAKTKAKMCFASAESAEQAGYRAPKK